MQLCKQARAFKMQLRLSENLRKDAGEIFLSLVSVFYIAYNIIWLSPESSWRTQLIQPVKLWWEFWGLNGRWSMFSPSLRKLNLHTIMTLTFDDGTSMLWEPPRLERMSLLDRFRLQRFRKWDVEYLPWDDYKECWPDLARYVARLNYNPANKPSRFAIHLYSVEIPPVDKEMLSQAGLPEHTKYSTIFVYKFLDRDFQ